MPSSWKQEVRGRARTAAWTAWALGAALLLAPAAVRAQPAASAEARELTEQGRRSYNLGHWQESIDRFERAYQLTGDAALLFNLAQAHRQAGHVTEALHFYRSYLRERPSGGNRDVAEKQIRDLEKKAQSPETAAAKAPPALLTPAPVARAPVVPVAPAPVAPPPPAPATAPPAPVAAPPAAAATPPAGAPLLVQTSPPQPTTGRGTPLPRWLPWAGLGATLALGAAAVLEGLAANSRYDELRSSCGATPAGCTTDQIDGVRSRDRLTTALWMATGVAAAGTGVMFYVNTRETSVSVAMRF